MILLLKPHWSAKNISQYVGCGLTKAYEIMAICRKEYGGAIKHEAGYVSRDSVLAYLGTTSKREIELYRDFKRKEVGHDEETLHKD